MPLIPETWLDQFTVNTVTNGSQTDPAVIQLANGNILVSWTSDDDTGAGSEPGTDIIGQLYDPLGNPIGSEFQLNTSFQVDNERDGELAALPDGGFLMVYEDFDGDTSIRFQEYNSLGTSVIFETIVNDTTVGDPASDNPDVAVSSSTSALIVYENGPSATSSIVGRFYNPSTDTLAGQFNLLTGGEYRNPSVARLANGNYAIVAERENGADDDLRFRVVDPAGVSVVANTAINGTNGDGFSQSDVSVTGLTNGNFVVTFANPDISDTDVRYVIYNATGTFVADGNAGFPAGIDNNNEPDVVALADGGFVIVLDNDTDERLEITHVNNAGAVQGTAIINTSALTPRIIALDDGRFAVVWRNQSVPQEVQMQIMDTRDNANGTLVYTPDNWQIGTVGDDVFTANGGAEFVHGWEGNDTITEAGAVKQYFGDDGDDIINVTSAINTDLHDGGSGNDTIDWSGSTALNAIFDLAAGTATQAAQTEQMLNFENLVGTGNRDKIKGTADVNTLEGGDGNDVINGRGGADVMRGGAGDDRFRVDDVNDQVIETNGEGTDKVESSVSFKLKGQELERLKLLGPNDIEGSGNNLANTIIGNNGSNFLRGAKGKDVMAGQKGADTLEGGKGADTLTGGKGADILVGAIGGDTLTGSAGADTFLYTRPKESTVSVKGRDTITDFSRNQGDKIDLSEIDARIGAGNQEFDFIDDAAFSGQRGELRLEFTGSATLIQADRNGDGAADFEIRVANSFIFVENDFIL